MIQWIVSIRYNALAIDQIGIEFSFYRKTEDVAHKQQPKRPPTVCKSSRFTSMRPASSSRGTPSVISARSNSSSLPHDFEDTFNQSFSEVNSTRVAG